MPENGDFTRYLRDVESMLIGVPTQQRAIIRQELLAHLEDMAAEQGKDATNCTLQEAVIASLGSAHDLGLAFYEVHRRRYEEMKRIFDVSVALLFLAVLSPLLLLISLLIKLDSPGPIFYRDRRIGRNGQRFALYKFRSMVVGCGKLPLERRVTHIGTWLRRTSLDELPQFFNVLRGEMSIVGPRPATPGAAYLTIPQGRCLLALRPGLTGPAVSQHVGGNDAQGQLAAAFSYLEKQSLRYDTTLVLKTLGKLLLPGSRPH